MKRLLRRLLRLHVRGLCLWGLYATLAFLALSLFLLPAVASGDLAPEGAYAWRTFSDDSTQLALMQRVGGVWLQVGGYDLNANVYRPLNAGEWGAPTADPPTDLPSEFARGRERIPRRNNFGVDWKRVGKGPRYRINGREITREEALDAIQKGGTVPDDSRYLRLTIIGSKADCTQVVADLKSPTLSPYASRLAVQVYHPEDRELFWAVSRYRFVTSGKPTIYLQEPLGKVRWRLDSYPGASDLADAIRAEMPAQDREAVEKVGGRKVEAKVEAHAPAQAEAHDAAPRNVAVLREPHPDYDPSLDMQPGEPNVVPSLAALPPDYVAAGVASASVIVLAALRKLLARKKGVA